MGAQMPAEPTRAERYVGVLALQGGVEPHLQLLASLGIAARPVRSAETILSAVGLVLPGGESTAQRKLLALGGLEAALDAFVRAGRPVLATCAGLIVAATRGYLNVAVERNAYGPQLNSCEALLDDRTHRMTFIRAPAIRALGPGVELISTLRGQPVVVVQGPIVATNGHPELVADPWLHERTFRHALARPA